MAHPVQGIIPPLTTPFTPTGKVYEKGLRQLVDFHIDRGVQALFICGTYGLSAIMSLEQRQRVHEIVTAQVRQRIAVIVHAGAASTAETVQLALHAESVGADCVACIPPFYHAHDEREVLAHYRAVVKAVNVPVYAYNNPKVSGFTITPSMLRKLADLGVAGIKDSSMSYMDFLDMVLAMEDRPDFRLIVGTEALALPAFLIGARGCISGLSNVFPEHVVRLWAALEAGKYEEAARMGLRLGRARQILQRSGSPNAACYAGLAARGIDAGVPKLPTLPLTDEKTAEMLAGWRALGLL